MRLLDRLDALDRRLGIGQKPSRPPMRMTRWIGTHPLTFALVYAAVIGGALLTGVLLTDLSLALTAIQTAFGFLFGLSVGLKARNECEAWDRRTEEG